MQFLPHFSCKPSQFTKPCEGFAFLKKEINNCAPSDSVNLGLEPRSTMRVMGVSPLCRLGGSRDLGQREEGRRGSSDLGTFPQVRSWNRLVSPTAHLHRHCLQKPCHEAVLFSRDSHLFKVTICKPSFYIFLQNHSGLN